MRIAAFGLVYGGLAMGALLCVSCGGEKADVPDTYPVSITITYNGEPIEGAKVTLVPQDESGRGASGITDSNGVAEMGLPGLTKGVVPGKYWVGVSKVQGGAADQDMTAEEFYASQEGGGGGDPTASAPKHALPQKYVSARTSGLECEVTTDPDQAFEFNLTD